MTEASGHAVRLEMGSAIFGSEGMERYLKAGAGVWVDDALAGDFLQCAVQSGIGTLRVAVSCSSQEAGLRRRLEEFQHGCTTIEFADVSKGCDRLASKRLAGVSVNLPETEDRLFEQACARCSSPFVSALCQGAMLLLRFIPASGGSFHLPECEEPLRSLAGPGVPDWCEKIAARAAGFHAWHMVQSALCCGWACSRVILIDLFDMRWCDDKGAISEVMAEGLPPEGIPWQDLCTRMR